MIIAVAVMNAVRNATKIVLTINSSFIHVILIWMYAIATFRNSSQKQHFSEHNKNVIFSGSKTNYCCDCIVKYISPWNIGRYEISIIIPSSFPTKIFYFLVSCIHFAFSDFSRKYQSKAIILLTWGQSL